MMTRSPRRTLGALVRFALGMMLAALFSGAAPAIAQGTGCANLEHVCPADKSLSKAVKKAGRAIVKCAKAGVTPCDLAASLAGIPSASCRSAVECRLNDLLAGSGGAVPGCSEGLFTESYGLMRNIVKRIDKDKRDLIGGDRTSCDSLAARSCADPVSPPLANACAGATTPAAAAACVCAEAGLLADSLLLTPTTCRISPAPPPPVPAPRLQQAQAASAKSSRPNIVLILTDDQRWDTLDATHSLDGTTPIMPILAAELAASGVTFRNAFHVNPLCAPSRSSLLTGLYSHNTGILDNLPPSGGATIFDDTATISIRLHDAGYRTGLIGKYLNQYVDLNSCIPPGWDDWEVFQNATYYGYDLNVNGTNVAYGSAPADYSTDVLFARAVQFIQASAGAKAPFFLFLTPFAPHSPATPAPRHAGLFAGVAPWRPASYAEPNVTDKPAWVRALTWTTGNQNNADALRQGMLESLQAVDEGIRDVMNALRAAGVDGKTVVIFAGDNGYCWGEHRWSVKSCPYEECIRMPLVIRDPSTGTAARSVDELVQNVDFNATIADLAGLPAAFPSNGTSLVPLLTGTPATWRSEILTEHWNGGVPDFALVRDGRWKYVEYVTSEIELYDLQADPAELTNIATDPANAALIAAMAARLHALQAQ